MKNKANVLAAATVGIAFWVGVIYLFTGTADDHKQPPAAKAQAREPATAHPDWTHIKTIAQAESECPINNNTCLLQGAIAEWGKQCKQWILLETDKSFTTAAHNDIHALFNTRLNKDSQGQYILRGIEMKGSRNGLEFRYEYGCRIDPERQAITGIAPPEPIYTQKGLRFKNFN